MAAFGPLLSPHAGFFAFRFACGFIIVHAVLFLMGRQRWSAGDQLLVAALFSFGLAGLVGLFRVVPGSDNPSSEFFSVMLGLFMALALRAWQRHHPGIYIALARGWVLAGVVSCGIAFWELRTGSHLPGYLVEAAPAPAATFGNPNALAMFVVMAQVWAIPVRRCSGTRWRLTSYLLAAMSPPLLVLTDARLAMLVWVAVMGFSVWFDVAGSVTGRAFLAAAALPIAVAAGVVSILPKLASYLTEAGTAGTSGGVRQALTTQGLGFALENRGLPTWPGAFESMMLDHGDLTSTLGLINAHNTWVELLVQYGLLSLVLMFGWMIACVTDTPQPRGETLVAVATLLVLGVVNSSSLDDGSFWLFVATLAASTRVFSSRPSVDGRLDVLAGPPGGADPAAAPAREAGSTRSGASAGAPPCT